MGYVITHVPGGVLASRYGGKLTLIVGMSVASLFTLLTPVCVAAGGAPALIIIRIIIGLGEGLIFPACTALLAAWVPLKERSKIGTLTYSGAQVNTTYFNFSFFLVFQKVINSIMPLDWIDFWITSVWSFARFYRWLGFCVLFLWWSGRRVDYHFRKYNRNAKVLMSRCLTA